MYKNISFSRLFNKFLHPHFRIIFFHFIFLTLFSLVLCFFSSCFFYIIHWPITRPPHDVLIFFCKFSFLIHLMFRKANFDSFYTLYYASSESRDFFHVNRHHSSKIRTTCKGLLVRIFILIQMMNCHSI